MHRTLCLAVAAAGTALGSFGLSAQEIEKITELLRLGQTQRVFLNHPVGYSR